MCYRPKTDLNDQNFISNSLSNIPLASTTNSRHYHSDKFLVLRLASEYVLEIICKSVLSFTYFTAKQTREEHKLVSRKDKGQL